jgi:hypothetical protein
MRVTAVDLAFLRIEDLAAGIFVAILSHPGQNPQADDLCILERASHFPHFGFWSSSGPGRTFTTVPRRVPFVSVMQIRARALPLTSSMFFHTPTGEALSARAADDISVAAR